MWTLLLKNKLKYPASMSNNGILNVAEYRYFVAPIVVTPGRPTERSPNGAVIISASKKKTRQPYSKNYLQFTTMPIKSYWTSSFPSVVDWWICPQPPSYLLTNTSVLYKVNSHGCFYAKEVTDCRHLRELLRMGFTKRTAMLYLE